MPENRTPFTSREVRLIELSINNHQICRHNIVGSCPYCREVSENEKG